MRVGYMSKKKGEEGIKTHLKQQLNAVEKRHLTHKILEFKKRGGPEDLLQDDKVYQSVETGQRSISPSEGDDSRNEGKVPENPSISQIGEPLQPQPESPGQSKAPEPTLPPERTASPKLSDHSTRSEFGKTPEASQSPESSKDDEADVAPKAREMPIDFGADQGTAMPEASKTPESRRDLRDEDPILAGRGLGMSVSEHGAETRKDVGSSSKTNAAGLLQPSVEPGKKLELAGKSQDVKQLSDPTAHRQAICGHIPIENSTTVLGKRHRDDTEVKGTVKRARWNTDHEQEEMEPAVDNEPRGLGNYGDVCYANAVLQLLASIGPLREHCRNSGHTKSVIMTQGTIKKQIEAMCRFRGRKAKQNLVTRLRNIISGGALKIDKDKGLLTPRLSEMLEAIDTKEDKEVILPFLFHASFAATQDERALYATKWAGTVPQESADYYNRLMCRLEKEADDLNIANLHQMMSVQSRTSLLCPKCSQVSSSDETGWALHLRLVRGHDSIDLKTLLDEWQAGDPVEDWRCDECKEMITSIQKVPRLERLNDHIILVVTRTNFKGKTDRDLLLPINGIDMAPYECQTKANEPDMFDLTGVIEHDGQGHENGHYTTLRRTGQSWWYCNDSDVSSVRTEDLSGYTQASIILLARRRQNDEVG